MTPAIECDVDGEHLLLTLEMLRRRYALALDAQMRASLPASRRNRRISGCGIYSEVRSSLNGAHSRQRQIQRAFPLVSVDQIPAQGELDQPGRYSGI